ncbi:MAG: hypothetical protein OEM59_02175 [Rhodospirillales bacterium]|nr:hypothetical protein [Rhodospirillales bacterium]
MAQSELKLAYDRSAGGEHAETKGGRVETIGKTKTEVTLTLANSWTLRGFIFTAPEERISDLLNDPRDFIPFLDASGPMRFLAKRQIVEIRPVE